MLSRQSHNSCFNMMQKANTNNTQTQKVMLDIDIDL